MSDNDEAEVADVQVEKDPDTDEITATVTKTDGSVSTGSSSHGIVNEPSTEEAIRNAD